MAELPKPTTPPAVAAASDRLDSWKEIAGYLKRDVTTVQRWERREGMPVHRHVHDKLGSVFAFRSELDAWMARRAAGAGDDASTTVTPQSPDAPAASPRLGRARRWVPAAWLTAAVVAVAALTGWLAVRPRPSPVGALTATALQTITDFDGTEQAAAISHDGQFVAFLSDRDGRMDVWVTSLATGQFYNLTRGRVRELVNPAVRTLGFTRDAAFVTFWARGVEGAQSNDIGVWAIPTLGGPPRPFLEGVAEYDDAPDGSRLVYHTPGPGDPMFVRDAGQPAGSPIHAATAGQHAHFPTWSRDGNFIYFVEGTLPDALDIYRMRPDGRDRVRVTRHEAAVSHPVFLDDRTLLYLVRLPIESGGAQLYALDVSAPAMAPRVLSTGFDRYTSLSASADGRRVVATLASPKSTLWRLRLTTGVTTLADTAAISLPTGRGSRPRLGPGLLLYVAKKGAADSVWKLVDGAATELWSAAGARIVGGPALDRERGRVAITVEQNGRTTLQVINVDGTQGRQIGASLALVGQPAWTPDGSALTSAVLVNGTPHLFRLPLDGAPVPMVEEFAVDPAWSPAGDFVVYSSADIGTSFAVKAVAADGAPLPSPQFTLARGARQLRFLPQSRVLIVMRGALQHKDLWAIDLDSGEERQLTALPADFTIRDFDLSPDGLSAVVERVQDHADVVRLDFQPAGATATR